MVLCVCSAPDDLKTNVGKIESVVNNPTAPNQVALCILDSEVIQKLLHL